VRAERGLKSGELKGIICTSSMELGLDVGTIDLVIQYNSPRQATRLVQRVGRSGHRVGGVARGAVIVQDPDDALESLVLVSRAKAGELEPTSVPETPLDVLLHALTSELITGREAKVDEILETLSRAHPFRNLREEDILRVLDFAQSLEGRMVKLSGNKTYTRAGRVQGLFEYYFGNLSMIPEVKQYLVVDEERNQPVGVLDESFVAEYGEPGVKFVMGGELWRVVQVFKSKVYVRPDEDPVGAIPTWVGEEIPVPFEVAREVGRLRRIFEEGLESGRRREEILSELAEELDAEAETIERAMEEVERHVGEGLRLPTDRRVTVEQVGDLCVVNACFGTLVNRTLARLLAHRLSKEIGAVVATSIDPYRIILRSDSLDPERVAEILREKPEAELREIIEESRFFRWRLAQIARRMGILARQAELTSGVLDKLMRALRGTPAFEEAFKETSSKDLDFCRTSEVLQEINVGSIEVVSLGVREKPTPISEGVWKKRYQALEPVMPRRLKLLAIASAEARLLSETLTLACLDCKRFVEERKVYELQEHIECPLCGSAYVSAVGESEEEVRAALELHSRGRTTRTWRIMVETSKLISAHGKLAAVVLAGRGITPRVAKEVLSKVRKPGRRLFELILAKEREVIFRSFR
jgi:ATP-dependent Lhr-like helicase